MYAGTGGLYRLYKELPHASSLAEILPEAFIQQWSFGSLQALYYDQSSALLSEYFRLCMQIFLYSILDRYTRSSFVIDNDLESKLVTKGWQGRGGAKETRFRAEWSPVIFNKELFFGTFAIYWKETAN